MNPNLMKLSTFVHRGSAQHIQLKLPLNADKLYSQIIDTKAFLLFCSATEKPSDTVDTGFKG